MVRFTLPQNRFQNLLGIDFGSSRVRIWKSSKPDVIVDQPACLAVDKQTSKVLAVGDEAYDMEGRVSSHISVEYPIRDGVVYDDELAVALLKVLLEKHGVSRFQLVSPSIMVSVPASATELDKQVMAQVVQEVGAREVFTIAQPLAASIGAGVPIADASGSFVMHLGAGVVEAALISLGSIVRFETSFNAGEELIQQLKTTVKQQFALDISLKKAEQLLHKTISFSPQTNTRALIAGQNLQTGGPAEIEVHTNDFQDVVAFYANDYQDMLKKLLRSIPPELTVDVIDKGLLLSGGLSQVKGLEPYITQVLGIPVSVVDDPELAVIRGIQTTLENIEIFKESFAYQL